MGLDRSVLLGAIERLHTEMQTQFDLLNTADGKLGDGDLGITMTRGMEAIAEVADDLSEDLGLALLKCSQAFTKSSGSSYGTLMALAMMAIAKKIKGQTMIAPSDLNGLVIVARDQIQTRGKAELGGKTVLIVWTPLYSAHPVRPIWRISVPQRQRRLMRRWRLSEASPRPWGARACLARKAWALMTPACWR